MLEASIVGPKLDPRHFRNPLIGPYRQALDDDFGAFGELVVDGHHGLDPVVLDQVLARQRVLDDAEGGWGSRREVRCRCKRVRVSRVGLYNHHGLEGFAA